MDTALDELSWLAIHQPGVIRLLEDQLPWADGEALAGGLALAHQLLVELAVADGVPVPRLPAPLLADGLALADPAPLLPDALALPLLLTTAEAHAVARVVAAVGWAAGRVRAA